MLCSMSEQTYTRFLLYMYLTVVVFNFQTVVPSHILFQEIWLAWIWHPKTGSTACVWGMSDMVSYTVVYLKYMFFSDNCCWFVPCVNTSQNMIWIGIILLKLGRPSFQRSPGPCMLSKERFWILTPKDTFPGFKWVILKKLTDSYKIAETGLVSYLVPVHHFVCYRLTVYIKCKTYSH